jgi:hypothetical protein
MEREKNFSCILLQFLVIKTPDPDSFEMLDPDPFEMLDPYPDPEEMNSYPHHC